MIFVLTAWNLCPPEGSETVHDGRRKRGRPVLAHPRPNPATAGLPSQPSHDIRPNGMEPMPSRRERNGSRWPTQAWQARTSPSPPKSSNSRSAIPALPVKIANPGVHEPLTVTPAHHLRAEPGPTTWSLFKLRPRLRDEQTLTGSSGVNVARRFPLRYRLRRHLALWSAAALGLAGMTLLHFEGRRFWTSDKPSDNAPDRKSTRLN